ncbi:unnamed protein product, partial [Diplocarpon coronariae]
GQIAAWVGMIR